MVVFLKMLLENFDGVMPLIKVPDETTMIFDLKRKLEGVTTVPYSRIDIQFYGRQLCNYDRIGRLFEEYQRLGMPAPGEAPWATDMVVLDEAREAQVMCWLRFVDGSMCGENERMLVVENSSQISSTPSCSTSNGHQAVAVSSKKCARVPPRMR